MLKWVLFICITLWVYLILQLAFRKYTQMSDRTESVLQYIKQPAVGAVTHGEDKNKRSLARSLASRIAARTSVKRQTQVSMQKLQIKLAQAGNPFGFTATEWLGLRTASLLTGVIVGIGIMLVIGVGLKGLGGLLLGVFIGLLLPDFVLSRKTRQRKAMFLRQLPSVLDLLTVSVEAGLGFDQAIAKVSEKFKGPLADEFSRVLKEIQLGSNRSTALQRFSDRTGVDSIRLFVTSVIQAEKLGVGLSQVLRAQAEEVRAKRRTDAEERAMKAPVLMLFPLIGFVFPALFIVILGPAAINMIRVFAHN